MSEFPGSSELTGLLPTLLVLAGLVGLVFFVPSWTRRRHRTRLSAPGRSRLPSLENRGMFARLLSNLPGFAYRCRNDANWTMDFISQGCLEISGFTAEEFLTQKQSWGMLIHPDDRDWIWKEVQESMEERRYFRIQYRIIARNGVEKWMWEQGICVFSDKGEFEAIEGFISDISERRRIEDALRLSEEKYRRIVHAAQEGIWVLDSENRTSYVNPRMAEMLGRNTEELIGRPLFELLDEEGTGIIKAKLEQRRQGINERFEFRFRKQDGTKLWVNISASPIHDEKGTYIGALAMIADITGQKKETEARLELEDQLRQAQKMEAIGHLAGGVAHDFNNLLSPIIGYAEMGLMQLEKNHPMRRNFSQIMRTAERAKELTMQLLAFGRKQILEMKPVDVNVEIGHFKEIMPRLLREDIELEFKLESGLPPIKADATQIQQILMNLALNAQDAMPKGGNLKFETARISLEGRQARSFKNLVSGTYVMLKVSDTGSGMNEEVLQRVFEPFFTTKEVGRGTGLGLATVYGIVRQHLGDIRVHSSPGAGTSFQILLPCLPNDTSVAERVIETAKSSGGSEVILVAEDEDDVREMVREILVLHGYRVLDARNGEEALQKAEGFSGDIDLLLTDLIMPKMNGYELYQNLQKTRPAIRAVVMSGYTGDILNPPQEKPSFPLLPKPFAMNKLLEMVRATLSQ